MHCWTCFRCTRVRLGLSRLSAPTGQNQLKGHGVPERCARLQRCRQEPAQQALLGDSGLVQDLGPGCASILLSAMCTGQHPT